MKLPKIVKIILGLVLLFFIIFGAIYSINYYKYLTFKNEVLSLAKDLDWNPQSQVSFQEYSVKGGGCIDCASGYKSVLTTFRTSKTQDEVNEIIKRHGYQTILGSPFKVNEAVFGDIAQSEKKVTGNQNIELIKDEKEITRYVLFDPKQSHTDSVIVDYVTVVSSEHFIILQLKK